MKTCNHCGTPFQGPPNAQLCPQCLVDAESPPQPNAAYVLAGLASFFIPGLGQLVQGRLGMALLLLLGSTASAGLAYVVMQIFPPWLFLHLLIHLFAAYEAATYR